MGLCAALADLLDYPAPDLRQRLEACLPFVDPAGSVSQELVKFGEAVRALACEELQEAYTAAFDLAADCALYAGHHVFATDRQRATFMSRLAQLYREAGFTVDGGELPDYIPAILRFVDTPAGATERADLLADAVAPAAGRVADALERRAHPYAPLLRAALAVAGAARSGLTPEKAAV